jgi:hypothetical protein
MDDVLLNIGNFSSLVNKYNCDILLAPSNHDSNTWGFLKDLMVNSGVRIIDDNIRKDDCRGGDAIGLWFDKNGEVYGFPKVCDTKLCSSSHELCSWKSVHKIPNRDIGIIICREAHYIKPSEIKDVSILYFISNQLDFNNIRAKTLSKYGIPKEEIKKLYRYNINDDDLCNDFNISKDIIIDEDVYMKIKNNEIPLLACNAFNNSNSGLGFCPKSTKINNLEYHDEYCRINLSY